MKKQNTFIKFLIFVLVLLSTIFCIVLTNQYRIVVFSIAFMGFVFSFLSCTKYLIFNKQEDKIVLLNSYFNDLITEKVKKISLCKYKSCTISQRNTSLNKLIRDTIGEKPIEKVFMTTANINLQKSYDEVKALMETERQKAIREQKKFLTPPPSAKNLKYQASKYG